MPIEYSTAQIATITDPPGLDSIAIVLQDLSPGAGRIIIECFGAAWSGSWTAIGNRTIREFIVSCDADYLACRLWPSQFSRTMSKEKYLKRICEAVLGALRAEIVQKS